MARRITTKKIIFIFILLVFSLFTLQRFFFFKQVGLLEKISATLVHPFLRAQHALVRPVRKFSHWYGDRNKLAQSLADAQQERQALLERMVELESAISFDQETHELLRFKKRYYNGDRLLGQVIMGQLNQQESYFLVDLGSKHGVTRDMVALYKNCLLGRVFQVYPSYSKIILTTDKRCKVAAYCSKTRAQGIHEGTNSCNKTSLTFVSHLQKVREGDLVMSSGQGIVFPKGFALGRIKHVAPAGLYHRIEVEPLVDVAAIEYCYLLDKGEL